VVGFKSFEELEKEARFEHDKLLDEHDGDEEPEFDKGLSGNWNGFQRVGQGTVTNGAETGKRACGGYFGVDFCEHYMVLTIRVRLLGLSVFGVATLFFVPFVISGLLSVKLVMLLSVLRFWSGSLV
jgi:hypothetical protein